MPGWATGGRADADTNSVITVTCRNGEHFSIDPDAIERVEAGSDTVVHMMDGAKYVIDQALDELIVTVRDHRAHAIVVRDRLINGVAATPAATRHAHRGDSPVAVLPDHGED